MPTAKQRRVGSRAGLAALRRDLHAFASEERAQVSQRFFRTGPGEYGEGDVFAGVSVPDTRRVVKAHRDLALVDVEALLASPIHEERLAAVLLLVDQMKRRKAPAERREVFELYLRSLQRVNNWDLVDSSAEHIVGAWLVDKDRSLLDRLAASDHLWSRRVSVLATFHFIKQGDFADIQRLATRLLADPHDLMHKAVGWMLREMGSRGGDAELRAFLRDHAGTMPRTMLRYALEKLPPEERARWMAVRPPCST